MRRLACITAAITGWLAFAGQSLAERRESSISYHYVSLYAAIPDGYQSLDAVKVDNRRRVYGTVWACPDPEGSCIPSSYVYRNGRVVVDDNELWVFAANERGLVGGAVIDDEGFLHAALFRDGETVLLPRLGNEVTSIVRQITDNGTALVESSDGSAASYFLFDRRDRVTPLDFGADTPIQLVLNNSGEIAGTFGATDVRADRAFRIDARGRTTLLSPIEGDPESWGQAIDERGQVLGYSFVLGGIERIGVWKNKRFQTYFVQGTDEIPTRTNKLLFNEQGLIVATSGRADLNTYVIPKPGVRLKLGDLTDKPLPAWNAALDINDYGDMIGQAGPQYFWAEDVFLLERECER